MNWIICFLGNNQLMCNYLVLFQLFLTNRVCMYPVLSLSAHLFLNLFVLLAYLLIAIKDIFFSPLFLICLFHLQSNILQSLDCLSFILKKLIPIQILPYLQLLYIYPSNYLFSFFRIYNLLFYRMFHISFQATYILLYYVNKHLTMNLLT